MSADVGSVDLSTLLEKPDARLVRSASRKAACRLVPLLGAAVLVAWLDRATLANTASALEEAIALTVVQYGLAAGVFYISYLAMQIPTIWIVNTIGVRVWYSITLFAWGLVSVATAFVRNGVDLIALRFLLGLAEGGVSVMTYIYLEAFLLPDDLTAAWGIAFLAAQQAASIIAGPSAALMLAYLQGVLGLEGYQWVYIIMGLLAIVVGVCMFLFLIPPPSETTIWTEEERSAMLLVKSQQRSNTSRIKPSIANSLLSWKSWYMGSMALLFMAPNVMFLTFIPLFIESLLLTDPMVSESEARIFSVFLSTLPYILGSLGLLATSEALTNIKRNSRLLVGMAVLLAAEVLFATFYLGYTAGISWGIAHVSFLAAFTSCFQLPLDSLVALYNQDEGVAGTFAVHTTLKNIGGAVGPVLLSGLLLVYSIGTSVAILGTVFLVPLAVLYASFLIGLGDRSGKLYDAPLSPTRPLKHDEDGPGLYA